MDDLLIRYRAKMFADDPVTFSAFLLFDGPRSDRALTGWLPPSTSIAAILPEAVELEEMRRRLR
jgi:hypothetical protein